MTPEEVQLSFLKAWEGEVRDREERTGIKPELWRAAGRRSKEWPDKENDKWWLAHGPEMVQNYIKWRTDSEDSDWRIWEPFPGDPAIEIGVVAPFGDVTVRAIIDRIFVTPSGELVIVDLKTGSRSPDSDLQLGFYASACEVAFGIRPQWGAYWKAREGKLLKPLIDLDYLSVDLIAGWLRDFVRARNQGIYIPRIGSHCINCGVRNQCAAVNGPEAHLYDPHHPEYGRNKHGDE